MNNKLQNAAVRSIVSGNKRQATIKDSNLSVVVGDIVLIGRGDDNTFGSFDVGRVEEIQPAEYEGEREVYVNDVITDSSDIFKSLKLDLRKREIKREIDERIKKVDEWQKMKMYAEEDDTIAALVNELNEIL